MPVTNTKQASIQLSAEQANSIAVEIAKRLQSEEPIVGFVIEETNIKTTVSLHIPGTPERTILVAWNGSTYDLGEPGFGARR